MNPKVTVVILSKGGIKIPLVLLPDGTYSLQKTIYTAGSIGDTLIRTKQGWYNKTKNKMLSTDIIVSSVEQKERHTTQFREDPLEPETRYFSRVAAESVKGTPLEGTHDPSFQLASKKDQDKYLDERAKAMGIKPIKDKEDKYFEVERDPRTLQPVKSTKSASDRLLEKYPVKADEVKAVPQETTDAAPKSVAAAPKPVAAAPKPVAAAPKPVAAAPKPVTAPTQSAPTQSAPTQSAPTQTAPMSTAQPGSPNNRNPKSVRQSIRPSIDPIQEALWQQRTDALQKYYSENALGSIGANETGGVFDRFVNYSTHKHNGRDIVYDRKNNKWIDVTGINKGSDADWQKYLKDNPSIKDTELNRWYWDYDNSNVDLPRYSKELGDYDTWFNENKEALEAHEKAKKLANEQRIANEQLIYQAGVDDRNIYGPGRTFLGMEPGSSHVKDVFSSIARPKITSDKRTKQIIKQINRRF